MSRLLLSDDAKTKRWDIVCHLADYRGFFDLGGDVKLDKPFIIGGAHKCATSSLVSLINSNSHAFSLYETDMNSQMPTKYAQRFFTKYPDSREFFYSHQSAAEPYFKLQDFLMKCGYNFSVVGDKLPSHDENFFRQFREFRLVYACRRPESWIAKVNDYYFAQSDLRPALYQYLKGLINAYHHPDRIFVAYETFLAENWRVTTEIANFLGLPREDRMYEWWSSFQRIEQPVKHAQKWLKGHQSSSKTPESNDTLCHVKSAAFWDPIGIYTVVIAHQVISTQTRLMSLSMSKASLVRNLFH